MQKTTLAHLPPLVSPLTKGLGVIAGVTAISFAAVLAFEQYRYRELIRVLASMPYIASVFPTFRSHPETVLGQFNPGFPPKPNNRKP